MTVSIADHPVRELFDRGVSISLNSDDHILFASDIDNEYSILEKAFLFSKEEIKLINRNAIDSSLASEEVKNELLMKL